MDDLDEKLLTQLAQNARISVATLSRRLGVARSTIQARIERLETSGVIGGYTLRLGENATRSRIRATVLLSVAPNASGRVITKLKTLETVERVNTTSGRFDLALMVAATSTGALDTTLDTIGEIPGVTASESLIHLSTKLDRRL